MKTLFSLLIILVAFSSIAQKPAKKQVSKTNQDDIYYAPAPKEDAKPRDLKSWSAEADRSQFDKSQTDRIVTCLDNYRKERAKAFAISLSGVVLSGASLAVTDPDGQKAMLAVGGIGAILGTVLYIRAERLLSKKYLVIQGNGLSIKF